MDKDKEASKRVKDKESGVARGIDFQYVANVINFDFPQVVGYPLLYRQCCRLRLSLAVQDPPIIFADPAPAYKTKV